MEAKRVDDLQNRVLDALRDHCTYNAATQHLLFARAIGLLPQLRTVSRLGVDRLRALKHQQGGAGGEAITPSSPELIAAATTPLACSAAPLQSPFWARFPGADRWTDVGTMRWSSTDWLFSTNLPACVDLVVVGVGMAVVLSRASVRTAKYLPVNQERRVDSLQVSWCRFGGSVPWPFCCSPVGKFDSLPVLLKYNVKWPVVYGAPRAPIDCPCSLILSSVSYRYRDSWLSSSPSSSNCWLTWISVHLL